ncbi:dienelactone hydrolase [Sphaerosporella brunnea]|uniref:Dienelactone hydrolase n=1 Tax=Sphaerosporella brunnea TaxID=1250544 RepID=A0A5J5EQ39_9PEZI|nr:dienelactone hydrolase [Sphaerosporella brunnea]
MASKACCTIPPVVSNTDEYTIKGSYSALSEFKTYVTGSTSSKTGVLVIYDIFGMDFKQTLQGSDIIASSGHLVVMPDLFKGQPMDIGVFPPDTDERRKKLTDFFATTANPQNNVETVKNLVPALKEAYPSVEKWALVGYCWGGKIVTLLSQEGTPFAASAQCHPAFLDPEDGKKLTIPHLCIASKDEDPVAVQKFKEVVEANEKIRDKSEVVRWEGIFHGFMAARANLKDRENFVYYEKGYKKVVHFLKEALA